MGRKLFPTGLTEGAGVHRPSLDHGVPFFWPLASAMEVEKAGLRLFRDNLKFAREVGKINTPSRPVWAHRNQVRLDLDTMRLRQFRGPRGRGRKGLPVVIDAPYAGHDATIADYAPGQSLVETLQRAGLGPVFVTDWKSATPGMRDYDIDKYLAEINAAIDDLGGCVHLVGLCQGGWMSAMLAARFPHKVRTLVLAGSPMDTSAGKGALKKMVRRLPLRFYEDLVLQGGGLMPGHFMLAGWKNMHPSEQYVSKYVDLYAHIEERNYLQRTERFERWYETPVDLPGRYYLQAIRDLFRENRLARGTFVALGRPLDLKAITAPLYLLAGAADDITPKEQVFAAAKLVGTPRDRVRQELAPGGHIGLFMGSHTLQNVWPGIGDWIRHHDG